MPPAAVELDGYGAAGLWGCHFPGLGLAGASGEAVQGLRGAVFAAGHAGLQEPAPHLHRVQLLLWFSFTAARGEPWA